MRLWRLSTQRYAEALDGGYGLSFDGRWNVAGHPVTYAATSPSLCVLEKLVHVENPDLLPPLALVKYSLPDTIGRRTIDLAALPGDWRRRDTFTQRLGDSWLKELESTLLFVPSAIVAVEGSPDVNVLINHRHPEAAELRIDTIQPFELDVRLITR